MNVMVIGAGLAGCEAAWQLACRGIKVKLVEMKPRKLTPAHKSESFAELVCSNSFRGDRLENAVGLLKEEMRQCGSLIIESADSTKVPAGGALAVDRDVFAQSVTQKINNHHNIDVICDEITQIPSSGYVIIATGPLTSEPLAEDIKNKFGDELSFYDAAAPLISYDSINMEKAWRGARYGRGGDDYINCPMTKGEYLDFRNELMTAEEAAVHGFEDKKVFEGCMPVEVMARRGEDALRYGPLRPVGLRDPRTGHGAYAVLQLRQDNAAASVYNMVGFQTHLTFPEQKRVFSKIGALENAVFLRYGVMHRNTYINSPKLLNEYFEVRKDDRLFFAGQITGVEGYVESAASGMVAGIHLARRLCSQSKMVWPVETAIGSLTGYISNPNVTDFQPMNINFGIMPKLDNPPRNKLERYAAVSKRALEKLYSAKEDAKL